MSTALSSALSGLETSLQSSIPTDAELRRLESLLIQAHQAKIHASVAAAHAAAHVVYKYVNDESKKKIGLPAISFKCKAE